MTTTKSYSDKARLLSIYKRALKGQVPFLIVCTIVFVLMIPLVHLLTFPDPVRLGYVSGGETLAAYFLKHGFFTRGIYVSAFQSAFTMAVVIAISLVLALVQNFYLHSKKMTDFYHSLPVKRVHLMTANLLATMSTILAPLVLCYLVTIVIQMVQYGRYIPSLGLYFGYIALDLFCALLVCAVIYLFTTFVAVNVGTAFDTFAVTAVLGFTPMAFTMICMGLGQVFIYGIRGTDFMEPTLLLSPFTFVFYRYTLNRSWSVTDSKIMVMLVLWTILCALLFAATVFCYNRRKSEEAEQTRTGGVFQTIVKCMGAFCGGVLFLGLFYSSESVAVWMVAILCGSVIIGLIGELILSRGIRGIKRNVKWLAASGVLCCLVVLVCCYDLIGFSRRVPDPAKVESVAVYYNGGMGILSTTWYDAYEIPQNLDWNNYRPLLNTPEAISLVTEAHRMAVEDQPPRDWGKNTVISYEEREMAYPSSWISFTYTLKNGRRVERSYNRIALPAIEKLAQLNGNTEYRQKSHAIFTDFLMDGIRTVNVYNSIGGNRKPYNLTKEENLRLVEAARKDMLAEDFEEILNPSAPTVAYLEFQFRYRYTEEDYTNGECTVIVTGNYANTLEAMAELGLLEEIREPETIDRIVLHTPRYGTGDGYGVNVLSPSYNVFADLQDLVDMDNGFIDFPEGIVIDDPALIDAIRGASRGQMLRRVLPGGFYSNMLVAGFFDGAEYLGAQLVSVDVLPREMQEQYGIVRTGDPDSSGLPSPEDVEEGAREESPVVQMQFAVN